MIKHYLPRSLLGRSLLIIVTPLVLLQVVSAFIFYESHWDKVSTRLARGLAGDIGTLMDLVREFPDAGSRAWVLEAAARRMEIVATVRPGDVLSQVGGARAGIVEPSLARELEEQLQRPFRIDTESRPDHVVIEVQYADGVLEVVTTRKRLFSSTTYVFVMWMVGTSLILLGVATIFMRNQVRPILRLARAADDFGMGRSVPLFKPEGAAEIRRAAAAFIAMKERIERQISQRTAMLSGVSHDLRTPLTRMKLELEMMGDAEGAEALKSDVAEMERMLDGYLAFARGEGTEKPVPTDLTALLDDAVRQARRRGGAIDFHTEGTLAVPLQPHAFSRCVTNLLDNAIRHAGHVSVRAGQRGDAVEVVIDDDGPGIPEDRREEVFKPFYRIEESRNPVTGGVGLGLTIARDVVRGHGGELALADAPGGGLRARIRLPI